MERPRTRVAVGPAKLDGQRVARGHIFWVRADRTSGRASIAPGLDGADVAGALWYIHVKCGVRVCSDDRASSRHAAVFAVVYATACQRMDASVSATDIPGHRCSDDNCLLCRRWVVVSGDAETEPHGSADAGLPEYLVVDQVDCGIVGSRFGCARLLLDQQTSAFRKARASRGTQALPRLRIQPCWSRSRCRMPGVWTGTSIKRARISTEIRCRRGAGVSSFGVGRYFTVDDAIAARIHAQYVGAPEPLARWLDK